MNKSFIIINRNILSLCIEFIRSIEINPGAPYQVVIRKYKEKRTNQQNKTYWGRLDDISEQVDISGKKFDQETWHIYMKEHYLPDECEKGIEKWRYMPDGTRRLNMSTTDLNTKEFYDYRLQVEADGANMGVMFTTREVNYEYIE